MPVAPGTNPPIHIWDFTAGIFNGGYATTRPPSPLGAAQEAGTWGCIAGKNGGLFPLPKPIPIAGPTLNANGVAGGSPHIPIGLIWGGNRLGWDTFLIVMSGARIHVYRNTAFGPAAPSWEFKQFRDSAGTDYDYRTATGLSGGYTPVSWSYITFPYSVTSAITPVWDAPGLKMGAGTNHWPFYYDVDADRIKALPGDSTSQHGLIVSHLDNNAELVRSVAPPYITDIRYYESDATPYDLILNLEHRSIFSSYGSVSTGELFLVSRNQGGAIVQGTYSRPNVIYFPAVVPTGDDTMKAIPTPRGLLYVSRDKGAFLWNGDNTSLPASVQLRPDFYRPVTDRKYAGSDATYDPNALGLSIQGCKWGEWAILPNDWLYDVTMSSLGQMPGDIGTFGTYPGSWAGGHGSWWKLNGGADDDIPAVSSLFAAADDANFIVGVKDQITSAQSTALTRYELATLRQTYKWTSQPIPIGSFGQKARVAEVEVSAVPLGTGQTIDVSVINDAGTVLTRTLTLGTTDIPCRRRAVFNVDCYDAVVRVYAKGNGNTAPPIHSIKLLSADAGEIGTG